MYSPGGGGGGLEGKGATGVWVGGGQLCRTHPLPGSLKPPPFPGASSSSWGLSSPPTPLPLTLLTSHNLHLKSAHLGKPCGLGQCKPRPKPSNTGHLLSCPLPRPALLQVWCAQQVSFLRPSDLQVPFSTRLRGPRGAPYTQGHPWFPTPAWLPCLDPSFQHKNYQEPGLHPDQEKPALLTPGGAPAP